MAADPLTRLKRHAPDCWDVKYHRGAGPRPPGDTAMNGLSKEIVLRRNSLNLGSFNPLLAVSNSRRSRHIYSLRFDPMT